MKNRKSIIMGIAILVAIVGLAIGYALTASDLVVTGTANAKTTTQFSVTFNGTTNGTTTDTAANTGATASATDGATTGSCTVNLSTLNATGTCSFTFENKSPAGMNAVVNTSNLKVYTDNTYQTEWNNSTSEYFNIVVNPGTGWSGEKTLAPNATESFDVVVTLKKSNIGSSDVSNTFYVKLENITAAQAA